MFTLRQEAVVMAPNQTTWATDIHGYPRIYPYIRAHADADTTADTEHIYKASHLKFDIYGGGGRDRGNDGGTKRVPVW